MSVVENIPLSLILPKVIFSLQNIVSKSLSTVWLSINPYTYNWLLNSQSINLMNGLTPLIVVVVVVVGGHTSISSIKSKRFIDITSP